ncbi:MULTISPECIES: alpha/beta fold hydrolase [Thermodesulfovibrio]|jgi:pimeloyl-[acyl-carrier protein] methyl ester esterase|uniref:alpha/beta fold hydrolase n=1 Tax=Thermodesulfovibrio TaxID=28261 RepID=UPI002618F328|nr:alpha/beta hydrolase [Thermodesulfovibrio sp.]
MNIFISGWAGFREALGDIPDGWDFICPFIDFNEDELLEFLREKSGQTVVGWSTGGHIILKNLNFFADRFEEIIVVAGFIKFTKYVNSRVLRRMIERMAKMPEEVVKEFLIRAGCISSFPKFEKAKLIEGLNFLTSSEVVDFPQINSTLLLVHGSQDKIVPVNALKDLVYAFPFAKSFMLSGAHWIDFKKILKVRTPGCTRGSY